MFGIGTWEKWLSLANRQRPQNRRLKRSGHQSQVVERQAQSVERLEDRILLFAVSGNAWPNKDLITISFMPDGTNMGGGVNNLNATFNVKFGTAATWQNEVLKAAQYWAQQTNINFAVVSDNGAATGSGSNQQGDPGFGDIRIGGFNFGNNTLAQAYLPPPVNNYSVAGDIQINTATVFNKGTQYDLFTVMTHEFGHALGLNHATATSACMYATYNGVDSALNADDISGIKAIYSAGAVRAKDAYDTTAANEKTTTASLVTLNATSKAVVINGLDLTTSADLDYFKFVVPAGSTTTLKATVVSTGLSLLSPKVEIVIGTTSKANGAAGATEYGSSETATYTSATDLAAGKTVIIKVSSANALAAFKTGKYALILNMGTAADPVYTKPVTLKANGTPLSSGGGVAIKLGSETLVNAASTDIQQTSDRAVGMNGFGASVITWASQNQDGSGWGVFAQRYALDGATSGSVFQVNSTSVGDQTEPTVAVDALGNFWITWTSASQDGNGYGIYARRYDSMGNPLGGELRVNSTTANDQSAPSVASDMLGNAVITWTSNGQDGNGLGVYAQRYNLLGLAVGGEFRVNTTTAGDQSDSSVAINRLNGDFVVTWTSAGQDGSGAGIYAQRYSGSTGAAVGAEFRVNTTTTNDQTDASVAVHLFTGDFFVTWTSAGQDGSGLGIYGQRYSSAGVAKGTQILVNTLTTGDQFDSTVAIEAGGEVFVTWTNKGVAGAGEQVFGQQLEKNGNKKEAEFVVNATTANDQGRASVAIDLLGRAVMVWSGNGVGDTGGVFMQRYSIDLHGLEATEHDHGQPADESYEVPFSVARQNSSNNGHAHDLNVGSGTGADDRFVRLVSWLRGNKSEPQPEPSVSVGHGRREADMAKLSLAIDSLFGSEAWLSGRHYRSANTGA